MVRDTGIGHPARAPGRDLRALHAGRRLDDPAFGGTGLGLTISVAARGADGRTDVGGERGRPRAASSISGVRLASPRPSQRARGPLADQLQGLRVLVADDLAINQTHPERDPARLGLRARWSWRAGRQRSPPSLQARAERRPLRASSLLDARMPGRERVRGGARGSRTEPGSAPAIIMMLSSSSHAAEAARCHELGDRALRREAGGSLAPAGRHPRPR